MALADRRESLLPHEKKHRHPVIHYRFRHRGRRRLHADEAERAASPRAKGRVCNNVLGHDVEAMQDKGFQTLMIRGVQWCATGDATQPAAKD